MNSTASWYPIAANDDLVARHVFHGQLLGREFAVWRADDGTVNVWENRCPHRGVRLTLGSNSGEQLVCRYHGWRYASGSGACTHIPAHPNDVPSAKLCAATFPCRESGGLIWTTLGDGSPGEAPSLADDGLVLRALPVDVDASRASASLHQLDASVTWLVQPTGAQRCIVRGILPGAAALSDDERLAVLAHHHRHLSRWRTRLEAAR